MKDKIEETLREIDGETLVRQWHRHYEDTPVKPLPTAYLDEFALAYAIGLGATATAIDLIADEAFRKKMKEKHDKFSDEEAKKEGTEVRKKIDELLGWSEPSVKVAEKLKIVQRLNAAGFNLAGLPVPDVCIDFYWHLNDIIGLRDSFKLKPNTHRIINHIGCSDAIDMLMKGEIGFGAYRVKAYPEMSRTVAQQVFDLHMQSDRHTLQSTPLKIMAWLWEQSIRIKNPNKFGDPSFLFELLHKYAPTIDWKKWITTFFDETAASACGSWPSDVSLDEVMITLYGKGIVTERAFLTSNLGAAVGGMKRRTFIAAAMEVGVEIFALIEGVSTGFVPWRDGIGTLVSSHAEWRDQPKYIDMKILAQAFAATGPAARAVWTKDPFSQNIPSLLLIVKHLYVAPNVHDRHTGRLVAYSQKDCDDAIAEFEAATGIRIDIPRKSQEKSRHVAKLEQ